MLPVVALLWMELLHDAAAITCYECQSSQGQDCVYTATTCQYGVFGCSKIAIYSGGVDKLGNWRNPERYIVSMMRGCSIIPMGVDMCSQSSFFGYRLMTCNCFSDYCNTTTGRHLLSVWTAALALISYYSVFR